MESTSTLRVSASPSTPNLFPNFRSPKRVVTSTRTLALRRGGNGGGHDGGNRMVDEGMIILRKRIRDMKMSEKSYEEAPLQWTEWERSHYDEYNSMVCEVVGFMQTELMNLRPGIAIGISILAMLGVATPSAMLLLHLIETAKWMYSSLNFM